ncbi:MAG: sulfatase [Bacteroidales bacterium]|nr:sulfatase [Bacteroidales bacterium]
MNIKALSRLSLVPVALSGQLAFAGNPAKPNVVIFLVDDMGPMDTSVPFITDKDGTPHRYPLNDWYQTPNMERLARVGVRFSNFCAQSVSSPSRASLMTGQNAARHRTTNWIRSESDNRCDYGPRDWNWQGIKRSEYTLARLMKDAGYKTIHVGKAHFGPHRSEGEFPENIGFDVNIAGSSIGEPGSYKGENGYGYIKGTYSRAVPGLAKYHGTDTFLTEALTLEAIGEIDRSVEEGEPFFLYMSHYAVHNPFEIDKRFESHYLADSSKSRAAVGYATLVEGMDKSLGDIMDHLNEIGEAENTLIIFMGDNGGDAPLGPARGWASSAPLRGKKGSEYEGGMRVPCIIGWASPSSRNASQKRLPVKKGGVSTQVCTIMDVYPTLASLTGTPVPADHPVDGQDLSRLLSGKPDTSREEIFMCHFPHQHNGSYYTTYRDGAWKLVYYYNPEHPETPSHVLFNLEDDPFETADLSAERPDVARKLIGDMIASLKRENAAYPVDFEGKTVLPRID